MPIQTLNNTTVSTFIDALKSKEALTTLAKSLSQENLISSSPSLGSGDLKQELKRNFEDKNANPILAAPTEKVLTTLLENAFISSARELKEIYNNRNVRVARTFYLQWILFAVTSILVIVAAVMIFWQESNKKMAFATSISALILGFFSKTISKMHKDEDDSLKIIELDLRQLSKIENFFRIIDGIRDEEELKYAYQVIIKQLKI